MKIPLFDVDGTLTMKGNRIQNRALGYAFQSLYGLDASMDEIIPHGMIESQIIIAILTLHGMKEEEIIKDLEKIYGLMREYISMQTDTKYSPKNGAKEILTLLQQKGFLIGVLTGNMDTVAQAKLAAAGLWKYIDFGAYGNEAMKRVDLVFLAKERAEEIVHKKIDVKDFVIIGDTPKDIQCAKDAGIDSIAVSAGMHPYEEMEKTGANVVVHSLEEQEPILQFLQQ